MRQGSTMKLAEWKEFALIKNRQSVRDAGSMNGDLPVLICGLLNHGLSRVGFVNVRSNLATIIGNDSVIDLCTTKG